MQKKWKKKLSYIYLNAFQHTKQNICFVCVNFKFAKSNIEEKKDALNICLRQECLPGFSLDPCWSDTYTCQSHSSGRWRHAVSKCCVHCESQRASGCEPPCVYGWRE
jgi:hypothetical protein